MIASKTQRLPLRAFGCRQSRRAFPTGTRRAVVAVSLLHGRQTVCLNNCPFAARCPAGAVLKGATQQPPD